MVCPSLHHGDGRQQRAICGFQKILSASDAAPAYYDSDTSANAPRKKKARTGVLPKRTYKGKETTNNKGYQSYCVLYKKFQIPEKKYK